MEHIYSFSDMKKYGINALTGEACAYSMRVLCDLNIDGCKAVTQFLGLPFDPANIYCTFNKQWNSMVGDKEAVASIMLSRDSFRSLIIFTLFNTGNFDYVVEDPAGSFVGLDCMDKYLHGYLELAEEDHRYIVHRNHAKRSNAPVVNGRNVHAMSGRAE